jgi:hypothetical protein
MPSPFSGPRGGNSETGVIRNVGVAALAVEVGRRSQCIVPFSPCSENEILSAQRKLG